MSTEETARLLARVPLFTDLTERDLEQLAQVAVPRSYESGQAVFRESDTGDTCYVIREGAVRVTRRHSDGRVITLAELRPGDIFGELAMFGGETRSATVEALQPTRALALLAGASRESASRFLAKLERAGLITTGRGKVIVHDPGSLRNYIC